MQKSVLHHVTSRGADGCRLHAAILGAAAPSPTLLMMHGGGPDHRSLVPLARRLADWGRIVLPDVRGYGRSICRDPEQHRWSRYAEDVVALLDHLRIDRAVIGGAGLGGTIALRTALAYRDRVRAVVVISLEEIEDDAGKAAEIAFMDAFAERVRQQGIIAGWLPIIGGLAPIIGSMVREAIPRADPASIAAAAAIGHDRSFRSVEELAAIEVPVLIVPGMDDRHPATLAERAARLLPQGRLAPSGLTSDMRTSEEFAAALAPLIRQFLEELPAAVAQLAAV